jgi:hypothetical protein
VINTALEDVGVVRGLDLVAERGIVGGRVLAQQLDVLLGQLAGLFNGFGTLGRS